MKPLMLQKCISVNLYTYEKKQIVVQHKATQTLTEVHKQLKAQGAYLHDCEHETDHLGHVSNKLNYAVMCGISEIR